MLQSIETAATGTAKSISAYSVTANVVLYTVPDKRMFTGVLSNQTFATNYPVIVNGVQWASDGRVNSPSGKVVTLGPGTVITSGNNGYGYVIGIERDLV